MERDLWATFRDRVKLHGHLERIENLVGRGRPDVNYCIRGVEGNIELKQIAAWPAYPETAVAVPHYTPQQRLWHRQRLAAGGRVYVLLQIFESMDYLLFDAAWARVYLGLTATQAACRAAALVTGRDKFPTDRVVALLTASRGLAAHRIG